MADELIQFKREPYVVRYRDLEGQMQTVRRVPPPKLHDALPTDKVELTRKKNEDFNIGDSLEVTGISPRQPNVLQVKNREGVTSFIDYFDMKIDEKVNPYSGKELSKDTPPSELYVQARDYKYLVWP